jgi:IS1 family transposase
MLEYQGEVGRISNGALNPQAARFRWDALPDYAPSFIVKPSRNLLKAATLSTPDVLSFPVGDLNPLSHGRPLQCDLHFHGVRLPLHQSALPFNRPKCSNSSTYAQRANHYQSEREQSNRRCAPDPKLVVEVLLGCAVLCGGGPGLGMWAMLYLNDKRRGLRSTLGCLGLAAFAVGWLGWRGGLFFGLPYGWPPCYELDNSEKRDKNTFPHAQNVTQKHLTTNAFLYYSKDMANVLPTEKQVAIIGSLCEGSSIRAIERMTGVHRDTVMRLGVRVGKACTDMMNETLRDLDSARLEMHEIWGFIGKKEKHVRPTDDPTTGDVWTFCAIDADTKLVPTFKVGKRTNAVADAFVQDVASRMRNRVQISTDGLKAYVDAIEHSFGGNVDYAQIIKTYGHEEVSNNRRYSAPEFVASEKRPIFGNPDVDLISTSYVERLNATTRLHMRRLTRLTLAFSKKLENFEAAVGLHFAYYNFVKRHNTLRATPAQAAGVTGTQWTVAQLLKAVA